MKIKERKEDMLRMKQEARRHARWLGHRLGHWRKWEGTAEGGIEGQIRTARCTRCGTAVYLYPNGSRIGFPVQAECPRRTDEDL